MQPDGALVRGGPYVLMLPERATLGVVSEDEDRLAELRRRVAADHLGDPALGDRLYGSTESELRGDAEEFRDQASLTGTGRPSLHAAAYVARERQRRLNERVLGWNP
jgi:hypothetical protein